MPRNQSIANTICGHACALALLLIATPLAAQATDGIVTRVTELEVKLERIERLLKISLQSWEPVAPNIRAFNDWVLEDDSRIFAYEFAIDQNRGFRRLITSSWNGGLRFMTDFYWRGDHPTENPFGLGGSVWVVGTNDPAEAACTGNTAKHYYYQFVDGTVRLAGSGGCSTSGLIFARKRLFKEDIE